jgi:hypothetical protein
LTQLAPETYRSGVWRRCSAPVAACRLAGLSLVAWLVSACANDYRAPSHSEPHALVKLRLAYHAWLGPLLEQVVTIDGDDVRDIPSPAPERNGGAVNRPILVRPGNIGCTVRATFFHNDVTTHAESYETSEPAPCGATTCMQSQPHTRLVNQFDRVDDASCTQGLRFPAKTGESYVLEFDFLADRQCTLKCYRQAHEKKGVSVPCAGTAGSRDHL